MKAIEAASWLSIDNPDGASNVFGDAAFKVDRAYNASEDGYKNYLVDVTLLGKTRKLLFLESYGMDLPTSVFKRLFLIEPKEQVVAVDVGTATLYVGFQYGDKESPDICLRWHGKLVCENSGGRKTGPQLPKNWLDLLNTKRPYDFEIRWWAVAQFLADEQGWAHLRDNVVGVLSLRMDGDHVRYLAAPGYKDDWPKHGTLWPGAKKPRDGDAA